MTRDIFISHASEDKEDVARPLAQMLEVAGLSVWLDAHELVLGDRLRGKLDEGLAQSTHGLVVLSRAFFRKKWPQSELDALISREEDGVSMVLPIWHGLTQEELRSKSPLLAARIGISTAEGLEAVCDSVLRAVHRGAAIDGDTASSSDQPPDLLGTLSGLSAAAPARSVDCANRLLGRQVGRYVLREFVGAGGTGTVFRATHLPTGRAVALKLFFPLREETLSLTRATAQAVRGLSAVSHSGIAKLLDFGYFSKLGLHSAYLACEFVDGLPLDVWSANLEGRSDADSVRLRAAQKIAEALQVAHECEYVGDLGFAHKGLLHGDLKPANIIVGRADHQPKIVDFMEPDIQRLIVSARKGCALGRGDWFWSKGPAGEYRYKVPMTASYGTPGFMAPEQAIDGTVSPASDVYTLARTYVELFWPLQVDLKLAALDWNQQDRYRMDRARLAKNLDSHLDRELNPLLRRMAMPQPQDRIQSMATVTQELKRIRETVDAPAVGVVRRILGKLPWRR